MRLLLGLALGLSTLLGSPAWAGDAVAKAQALGWLGAVHDSPDWAAQMKRAAAAPLSADPMVLAEYTDACTRKDMPIDLRFGQCAANWKALADRHSAGWQFHALMATVAAEAGQADVAFLAGRMALELNQKDADTAYAASYYALQAGKPDDAAGVAQYAMGLEMREEFVAKTGLAVAQLGSPTAAVTLLDAAITLRPTSGVLLAEEGMVYAICGAVDPAQVALQRADATGYPGATLPLAWGHVLFKQGKLDEALVRYRQAIALDPTVRAQVPAALQGKLGGAPTGSDLCTRVEAIVAAGPTFQSVKGEIVPGEPAMARMRSEWRVSLPGAEHCSLITTSMGDPVTSVVCVVAKGESADAMTAAYGGVVTELSACHLPSTWTKSEAVSATDPTDRTTTWRVAAPGQLGLHAQVKRAYMSTTRAVQIEVGPEN